MNVKGVPWRTRRIMAEIDADGLVVSTAIVVAVGSREGIEDGGERDAAAVMCFRTHAS